MHDPSSLDSPANDAPQGLAHFGNPTHSPSVVGSLANVESVGFQHAQQNAFSALLQIVDITTEIFGEDVSIKATSSPDSAADRYVCLTAATEGDNEAILTKESEWVRRISEVAPVWDGFKLRVKRKT